jgi:hypothetical protein
MSSNNQETIHLQETRGGKSPGRSGDLTRAQGSKELGGKIATTALAWGCPPNRLDGPSGQGPPNVCLPEPQKFLEYGKGGAVLFCEEKTHCNRMASHEHQKIISDNVWIIFPFHYGAGAIGDAALH